MIGARRCLAEKGYARTTARDVVAASGANLASIGYHYGSKEALLNQALIQSAREWGDRLSAALAEPGEIWGRLVELIGSDRQLLAAQFEVLAQVEHAEDVREVVAEERPFDHLDPRVGALYQALLTGIMAQWLVDPATAMTGPDVVEALDIVARGR
ncbi:TetR family transcriptional regulator [Kutzneria sp. CA-103260]|nr:TetR family transcriptional regulator [Kutzneria sp. CA-103260]